MNIDFHYYGTFLAARLAGFENDEALRIAHSSQYVNESNASMIDPQLKGLLGETPQPTAIEGSEYNEYCKNPLASLNATQLTELQRVWMPFHFLPGNLNNEISYKGANSASPNSSSLTSDEAQENKSRLICNTNSNTVESMINDTHYDKSNLHMIGLRMHILADTWDHKYYMASPAGCINDKAIEKNDTKEFMLAFTQMVYALKCVKNNTLFKVNQYDTLETNVNTKVQDVMSSTQVDQSSLWCNLISELYGYKINPFDKNAWHEQFNNTAEDKKNTDYYLFNKSALEHRYYIEQVLNKLGLSLDEVG